jgi:uncharacterized LabA/DUF88 family protein
LERVAIFVDAGYLFAQGCAALTGNSKQPRSVLNLKPERALALLQQVAQEKASHCNFLRTYWYDGASSSGPSDEQEKLAHLDNVKLRLGLITPRGQQKGVDSLIVTDLIELARLGAISNAVLLSGDEDVRGGVQIAQNYGVRVHVLGIAPCRASQSKSLMQEADTTTEWSKEIVESFLSIRPSVPATATMGAVLTPITIIAGAAPDPSIEKIAKELVATLTPDRIQGVYDFWRNKRGVPPEHDGVLLGLCRTKLGRDLTLSERKHARTKFGEAVRAGSSVKTE